MGKLLVRGRFEDIASDGRELHATKLGVVKTDDLRLVKVGFDGHLRERICVRSDTCDLHAASGALFFTTVTHPMAAAWRRDVFLLEPQADRAVRLSQNESMRQGFADDGTGGAVFATADFIGCARAGSREIEKNVMEPYLDGGALFSMVNAIGGNGDRIFWSTSHDTDLDPVFKGRIYSSRREPGWVDIVYEGRGDVRFLGTTRDRIVFADEHRRIHVLDTNGARHELGGMPIQDCLLRWTTIDGDLFFHFFERYVGSDFPLWVLRQGDVRLERLPIGGQQVVVTRDAIYTLTRDGIRVFER